MSEIEVQERKLVSTKNAIVINENGMKQEFVVVNVYDDSSEEVYIYEMKQGERLIFEDISTALSMYKPKWENDSWTETATKEEIDALTPEPPPPAMPNPFELAIAEMSAMQAIENARMEQSIAELTILIGGMHSDV